MRRLSKYRKNGERCAKDMAISATSIKRPLAVPATSLTKMSSKTRRSTYVEVVISNRNRAFMWSAAKINSTVFHATVFGKRTTSRGIARHVIMKNKKRLITRSKPPLCTKTKPAARATSPIPNKNEVHRISRKHCVSRVMFRSRSRTPKTRRVAPATSATSPQNEPNRCA